MISLSFLKPTASRNLEWRSFARLGGLSGLLLAVLVSLLLINESGAQSSIESTREPDNQVEAGVSPAEGTRAPVKAPRPGESASGAVEPAGTAVRGGQQRSGPVRRRFHVHHHAEMEQPAWHRRLVLTGLPILFFIWFGGSIGSFLNVVIYRMPAGLNLSKPKSRCPNCLTPIRVQHNIPMLGWLMLRGKCYDCKTPISTRYPLIEATVAGFFVILFLWEFASGGAHLPRLEDVHVSGILRLMSSRHAGGLAGWFFWHAIALTLLLAMGMMNWDGARIPRRFLFITFTIPILIVLLFPGLYPVPSGIPSLATAPVTTHSLWTDSLQHSLSGAVTGVVGAVAGCILFGVIGGIISVMSSSPEAARVKYNLPGMGFVAGLFLGWQAVCLIVALFLIASLPFLLFNRHRYLRATGLLVLLAMSINILWWRELDQLSQDVGHWSDHAGSVVPPLVVLAILSTLIALCPIRDEKTPVGSAAEVKTAPGSEIDQDSASPSEITASESPGDA